MAKETKEERRLRIQKEVADASAARREEYFKAQEESKAKAAAAAAPLPQPDAYVYDYAWRQGVGTPEGELKLIKSPNPYYDASTNEIVDPATGARRPATQSMYTGAPTSSDSLYDAKRAAGYGIDAQGNPITTSSDSLYASKYAAGYGMDAQGNQYRGAGTQGDPITINGEPFTGTWQGKKYSNGILTVTSGNNIGTGNLTTGNVTTTSTGPTLAKDVFKSTLALYFGQGELAKGWMDELYNAVSKFYLNGQDVATSLNMALLDSRNNPNLKAFTDRFKGIYALQDLRQAGKPVTVPTIAEYVAAQAGMAETLNQVGLGDLATEQFTGDLIGKGNSVTTIADKVAKVFQRIDMAPKAIKDTLSRYFPTVDRTTLARTLLTGQKGVDQLVDELEQYDVLAAAEQQGVGALGAMGRVGGVTEARAQEYARLGETFGTILPKFGKVVQAMPTVSKLAGISGVADIGQVGIEKAVITQSAKEIADLQKLSEQEESRFAGKAGRAELGLASQRRANRAF